jgi:hypothetical protein
VCEIRDWDVEEHTVFAGFARDKPAAYQGADMSKVWSAEEFQKYQENLEARLCNYSIPDYMHEGLVAYILDGRATGSFLQAILSNDLLKAVARGDDYNQSAIVDYVKFLHNHAPIGCFGSEKVVDAWKEGRGFRGMMEREAAKHQ